jgi:D-arabinose 1-dehydrogenase-like Zn-dependent alcohol dehydrogenase
MLDGITLCVSIVGTRLDLQEALAFAGEGLRFMPPNRYYANAGQVVTDLSPASVLGRQVLEDAISFFYLSEARLTSMVSKP